ncbi:trna-splicing ligase hypothetical protein [Limosa lapponica baueri]|uniref:3'-phosphate/5'-hydroxy nucleic acid ligase n=1 Tax=Limosa lapponica baueri TaxID=1758121 RepID=A0A2I0UME9_LIMLA|nr:trna-splicing ligase hypothetical protein [Limosa lapponica baueri]
MSRSYNDELQYLDKIDKNCWRIKKGFVPNMHRSIGLPDVHSGYGFAIGNMAAFDMNDPEAVVSPVLCQREDLGTLGAGNHYAEIQVVDDIYNEYAARKMGIDHKGQVCVMIHSGSRGLGHQVATDALVAMEKAMKRDKIIVNDRQLACARIASAEGQDYLKGMAAAGNYAWVNRSSMTFLTRQAFAKVFNTTPDDLDMHVIYDVSHNIAKVEQHVVDGKERTLLVHRKGSTRAFPPHHPLIAVDYQLTGQPVLIGGTMGTCSYVLTGTEQGMTETFGTTCHGAGQADPPPPSPTLVTHPKNFNLRGLSVVVKYNTNGVGLVYPEAMKLLSEEIDTHY